MSPLRILSILLLTGASALSAEAAEVGARSLSIPAPERGRDLHATIWYPTGEGGRLGLVGDTRVFEGAPAALNATVAAGLFPLVLLSHGSGARVETMAWLAVELAAAGFIVVGPNHPGTTSGDSTPAATPRLWERTADLSAVIDYVSTDPAWRAVVDVARIGVIGFSLGGAAALEAAGALADLEAYARYCDVHRKWDCAWLAGRTGYVDGEPVTVEPVDIRALDKARLEQSNRDPRVRVAVLVDPALAQAYGAQSLKTIDIPLNFINLGSPGAVPEGVLADHLAALAQRGSHATVAGASHFDFLPECKEGSAAFLTSVGEIDPICDEPSGRSRADIHAEVKRLVLDALQRDLKGAF